MGYELAQKGGAGGTLRESTWHSVSASSPPSLELSSLQGGTDAREGVNRLSVYLAYPIACGGCR